MLGRKDAGRSGHYDVGTLFAELEGRTFRHYDELIEAVLGRMNAHLNEFPVEYDYRDAIAVAEKRGWLATDDSGRSVAVVCHAGPNIGLALAA